MSEQASSEAMRNVSPNRLVSAPPEYPYVRGTVQAAEVSTPFERIGWLLTSGADALEWLPDVAGSAQTELQAWVRDALRAARRDGATRDEAAAHLGTVLAVAEAKRVDDLDAFRAAALPR